MAKLPAFQFYPGDWRKDPGVQSLSFHDRGVWFELICLMHESEVRGKLLLNSLPMPDEAISRLLGLDNQILTTTLTTLLTYGVASKCENTGAIMSRRMVRDEEIRQVRKSCGKMGGNPNLVNQIPTTGVKVQPTPSSSSSSSSSDQDKENTSPNSSAVFPVAAQKVKKPKPNYPDDSEPMEFADLYRRMYADWTRGTGKTPTPAKLQAWAGVFDAMLRIDGHSSDQIERMMNAIDMEKPVEGKFCWKFTLLSPEKLRLRWNEGKLHQFYKAIGLG